MSISRLPGGLNISGPGVREQLHTLLVVEDPSARIVLARKLARKDHVIAVSSGPRALDVVTSQRVDLIVIDLGLRMVSAIATMQKLRADHHADDIPIVMITDRSDSQSAIKALEAGVDDLIVKPFNADVLNVRLRRLRYRADKIRRLSERNAELYALVEEREEQLAEALRALDMAGDQGARERRTSLA